MMMLSICSCSTSPPTNTSGKEILGRDSGTTPSSSCYQCTTIRIHEAYSSMRASPHSGCEYAPHDTTSLLLLHIHGSIYRTVSLLKNTFRIPLTIATLLIEIYDDVVNLTREITFVFVETINFGVKILVINGTVLASFIRVQISNTLCYLQILTGSLFQCLTSVAEWFGQWAYGSIHMIECWVGHMGPLVASHLKGHVNVGSLRLPLSVRPNLAIYGPTPHPHSAKFTTSITLTSLLLIVLGVTSVLCLCLCFCILLILLRQGCSSSVVSVTHHHHHSHYHTPNPLQGPSSHSSPMTRTDWYRYPNPLPGVSSTGTHASEDLNWEPDTSFAYQPQYEVPPQLTSQMKVSIFGTGVQPVSSKPPSNDGEGHEDEDSEAAENRERMSKPRNEFELTPKEKVNRKLNSIDWSDQGAFQSSTGDDGDISSQSSGTESSQSKGKAKWLQENGEYPLDRASSCTLHLLQELYCMESSDHLTKELSEAIQKTCTPMNTERYKIDLKHGISSVCSDTTKPKKPGRTSKLPLKPPVISQLQVDLDDDSELSKLVKSLFLKTRKQLTEVFGKDAEFDSAEIHRMAGPKHKIAYCGGSSGSERSSFSPTVGILSLGPSGTARPLFLKAATGGVVTHKVLLHPGSLCFLGGRTAAHYRYSIPKDYGSEGEHFTVLFYQKTPSKSILDELHKIGIPEKTSSTSAADPKTPADAKDATETPTPAPATVSPLMTETVSEPSEGKQAVINVIPSSPVSRESVQREGNGDDNEISGRAAEEEVVMEDTMLDKLRKNIQVPENIIPTSQSMIQAHHHTTTPLTAIPMESFSFNFDDGNDNEPCKQLVLAETLDAVVDKMEHTEVTKELLRNQTSTQGNLNQMKKRLKRRITMAIGEISASSQIPNTSMISMLHQPSPDILPSNLTNDIQKIVNCQENTDKALVNVLNEISGIKVSMNKLSMTNREQQPSSAAGGTTSPSSEKLAGLKKLFEETRVSIIAHNCKLVGLTTKVEMLSKTFNDSKASIESMADAIKESRKDIKDWRSSVFSDEATTKIDYIHGYVQKCYPDTSDVAIQTSEKETDSGEGLWGNEELPSEVLEHQDQTKHQETISTPNVESFWPKQIEPTLDKALKEGHNLKVCLITDSIMRHITGLDSTWQYKYKFYRIDCRDSNGLNMATTKDELKRIRPHMVYVHLGINDLHRGADVHDVMDNMKEFDRFLEDWLPETRIVISLPLDNGKPQHNRLVAQLRSSMALYGCQGPSDHCEKRIHLQHNNNMLTENRDQELHQRTLFFSSDKLHLSERGKNAMLNIMRSTLHKIFKGFTASPLR